MKEYIIFLLFLALVASGGFNYILFVAILAVFIWMFIPDSMKDEIIKKLK